MTNTQNTKPYNLEDRTLCFALDVREFTKKVRQTVPNMEYTKQLIRSSASVGANYIEANESLGKKDFVMRMRICKKEAKESRYWLELIDADASLKQERLKLQNESTELIKIFAAIVQKSV
jgi:four helix bundle protein